jgi:predicted kinase
MTYHNMRTPNGAIETIDAFETRKEAKETLADARMAYRHTGYVIYLSQRPTKEWRSKC